jgi:methionyl-tRNA formyltransferase
VARVTDAYLQLLEKNLGALLAGTAALRPQDGTLATYARKRTPDDNRIDWTRSSQQIYNLVRGCSHPYPGAFCHADGKRLTIWRCDRASNARATIHGACGRIIRHVPGAGAVVAASDGELLLRDVQLENGRVVPGDAALPVGTLLT